MIQFVPKKGRWLCDAATALRAVSGAALIGLFATYASVAQDQAPPPATNAEDNQEVGASEPIVNRLTQAAVSLGALTCAAKVQQVTSYLGATASTQASIRRPVNPPDRNSLSLVMATQTDGVMAVAMADFYPTQGGCKASYNLTVNLPMACADLRDTGFASLGARNVLAPNITVLGGATSMRVVLMDAFDGCTVVKTETLE